MAYKKFFVIGGTILIIIILFVLVVTFAFKIDSPLTRSVQRSLHLPALIVDGRWISVNEIERNTDSIKRFYENQDFSQFGIRIDFATEDGKKRLKIQERKMINKLIEDIAIEEIAEEYNISISDEAVRSAMERPMDSFGTRQNVETTLDELYGWTIDDFGEKVVRGQLLREKIAAKYEKENQPTEEMKSKIMQAQKELADGRTFEDVARKYSQGQSASDGGIMGWFRQDQLQGEIGRVVAEMSVGDHSDVLETSRGLHIVRVNDISETEERKMYHISQIIVWKKTFSEYLEEKIAQMDVQEFLPAYVWDSETGYIVFSDQNMIDFEQKMYQEAIDIQEQLLNNT